MFKNTKFINKMFTVLFLSNSLASLFTFKWLFEIAYLNLTSDNIAPSSDRVLKACSFFTIMLFSSQIVLVGMNSGILFCRFIYIRHATGLMKEGRQLFHRLVMVLITCFTLQFLSIFPFSGLIKNYDLHSLKSMKVSFKHHVCNMHRKQK